MGWESLKDRRIKGKLCLFYKIKNNLTLSYLLNDLNNYYVGASTRNTRTSNTAGFKLPFCRTEKFKNSYFPATIKIWNNLSLNTRCLDSLNKFKKFLNNKFEEDQGIFDYNLFSMQGSKILSQFRLGLSNLASHLFQYNLSDNPFCKNCLKCVETQEHYLFDCPCYLGQRQRLEAKLALFVPDYSILFKKDLVKICIFGVPSIDFDTNFNILRVTCDYINESMRFNY